MAGWCGGLECLTADDTTALWGIAIRFVNGRLFCWEFTLCIVWEFSVLVASSVDLKLEQGILGSGQSAQTYE